MGLSPVRERERVKSIGLVSLPSPLFLPPISSNLSISLSVPVLPSSVASFSQWDPCALTLPCFCREHVAVTGTVHLGELLAKYGLQLPAGASPATPARTARTARTASTAPAPAPAPAPTPAAHERGAAVTFGEPGGRDVQVLQLRHRQKAVSYTHLTLPTMYCV